MGRSFRPDERESIIQDLKRAAYQSFSDRGIKGTTVEGLTQEVGISKGAFYQFFPSKEELFFDLVEEKEKEMREPLLSLDLADHQQLKETILGLLVFWKTDPLLRIIVDPREYQTLLRKLPQERLAEHLAKDDRDLGVYLGKRMAGDDEQRGHLIAAVFRGLFLMTLHEKEIGEENMEPVLAFLVEAVLRQMEAIE